MLDVVKYPTPSPQPGDIIEGSSAGQEGIHGAISPGEEYSSQTSPMMGISGVPQTPVSAAPASMVQDAPQQYAVGYYQYAVIPGNYYPTYSTPPSVQYPTSMYPQIMQAVPTTPQIAQRQVTYSTGLTGTPIQGTAQIETKHQVQHPPRSITGTPVPQHAHSLEPPTIVQTSNRQRVVMWNFCQFCQNNREPESFYRSHILRDAEGIVVCPVLRSYNCPICNNGGGDRAHTKSYCPQLRCSGRPSRKSHFHQ